MMYHKEMKKIVALVLYCEIHAIYNLNRINIEIVYWMNMNVYYVQLSTFKNVVENGDEVAVSNLK